MYRPYFESAARFLDRKGIGSALHDGPQLSDSESGMLSKDLGVPVPEALSGYLRELGDGFRFQWEMPGTGNLVSFGISFLSDIKDECKWVHQQLQQTDLTASADIFEEAKKRLNWIPVMGIGEGGYEFCLDTSTQPAPVRCYETEWPGNPTSWKVSVAASLHDLVRNWSRYCFSGPLIRRVPVSLLTFAGELDRNFDWSPSHFDLQFDRGTSNADL